MSGWGRIHFHSMCVVKKKLSGVLLTKGYVLLTGLYPPPPPLPRPLPPETIFFLRVLAGSPGQAVHQFKNDCRMRESVSSILSNYVSRQVRKKAKYVGRVEKMLEIASSRRRMTAPCWSVLWLCIRGATHAQRFTNSPRNSHEMMKNQPVRCAMCRLLMTTR